MQNKSTLFGSNREGVYMNKPMNFICLTDEKLRELGSLCPVSDNDNRTFTDFDFDASQTIPCLEQPALKHIVMCVEDTTLYEINTYHNVRMTKDIWDSGILISKSYDKIDIKDEPDEYTDGKVMGQHWLEITISYCSEDRKVVKWPTIHVRPSISAPGYIDIRLPPKGAEFLYDKLKSHGDNDDNGVYATIFDKYVKYIVVNRILLNDAGKYHKTGSKVFKSSVLSMVKRTLPRKVSLKNITIDTDAFIVDYQPKKHDASTDAVKIWHCPAWEVRGHYRHCKSGKVTYVKPHAKGKLRDTLVVGREYDLDVK